MKALTAFLLSLHTLLAGPYAPAANSEGTSAISLDDERITRWADTVSSYSPGEDLDELWTDTTQALGPASTIPTEVTSLGRGGVIILEFDPPIPNRPGPDFAIFENSFSHTFLELAFVEISSDGQSYQRFQNSSLTVNAVGPFGFVDTTNIDGLAGKYIGGFGTPFDLDDLTTPPVKIRFIKLIDVTGGTSQDSSGATIYDPFPTQGSSGFDLSGIAIFDPLPLKASAFLAGENFILSWQTNPGLTYLVESSPTLNGFWQPLLTVTADSTSESFSFPAEKPRELFRVSVQDPPAD